MNKKFTTVAIGSAFAVGLAASPVSADTSPFGMSELDSGYQVAMSGAADEGKCGEGKCGEGKCGGKSEGKCGEGKCGTKSEGKCGEGKCGTK